MPDQQPTVRTDPVPPAIAAAYWRLLRDILAVKR